ncbi:MAG: DUF2333 family protein [Acidihalobacter sp.]
MNARPAEMLRRFFGRTASLGRRLLGAYHPRRVAERGPWRAVLLVVVTLAVLLFALGWYWSREPAQFDVQTNALNMAGGDKSKLVTGYVTTATLIRVSQTLLDKPGGYISNDVTPPGVFLDNMPNWEYGVLTQIRDLALAMRNDFSRSQSQSAGDRDLDDAQTQFNFPNNSWMFPSSEREYGKGIRDLQRYLARLSNPQQPDAQFYARADNLNAYLGLVDKRLGAIAQRLAASVGEQRIDTSLAGDSAARQATPRAAVQIAKTPWLKIDDVFYESRGSAWALIEFLKALQIDFHGVLAKKNALVSMQQTINYLQGTQEPIWSPIVLNGSGFGLLPNYSLVMASYISRAEAALIDLRTLLSQG